MKTPDPTKAESSAPRRQHFTGTDNPRHMRVIHAVLGRPRRREDIDSIAGCSNGPELIAELRRRGLEVPCDRIKSIDHDGYRMDARRWRAAVGGGAWQRLKPDLTHWNVPVMTPTKGAIWTSCP